MEHPCHNGPDRRPCGDDFNCRPCYLYRYRADYNLLWGGDGKVEEAEGGVLNGVAWLARKNHPSLLGLVGNALAAAGRIVAAAFRGEPVVVSEEEQGRRLAICRGCEFFANDRCLKCGCFANLKARLETEHCPLTPPKW